MFVQDALSKPVQISGWVNGNLYIPTCETLGILPIPHKIQVASSMASYIPSVDGTQRHQFLARKQGTRKPILPIHTASEKQLFHHLMISKNSPFSPESGEPRWGDAVKVWNSFADRNDDIYYKVCCLNHNILFRSNRHSWKHNKSCLEKGVCKARFPRQLIPESYADTVDGVERGSLAQYV